MIPHAAPMLGPGSTLAGRYRLESLLGQGGFGSVYSAIQLNIGSRVAVKLLRPELLAFDSGLGRFQREARLAQRLTHPNTVRLLDFGTSEPGVPFIVFEYLDGQPLDAVLRSQSSLPVQRVGRVTTQILKSLMEAHDAGIVHRDIKPANIFLCHFQGEPDYVKVLDFGIAKAEGADNGFTGDGQMIGTPAYMSPEQVLGHPVTPATDLYSLGLLMAEALSGQAVFSAGAGQKVCVEQVSPAPVELPGSVQASVLGPIIGRALQKDPTARFHSASQMLEQLQCVLGHSSQNAAPGLASQWNASTLPSMTPNETALIPAMPASGIRPASEVAPQAVVAAPPNPGSAPGSRDATWQVPTPSAATALAQMRPRSSARLFLIGGGVALASAGLGAGALWLALADREPGETEVAARASAEPAPAPTGVDIASAMERGSDFENFSFARAKKQLQKRGWILGKVKTNLEGGFSARSAGLSRGAARGTLTMFRYDGLQPARSFALTERQKADTTVTRSRRTVLVVWIPGQLRETQDIVDLVTAAAQ